MWAYAVTEKEAADREYLVSRANFLAGYLADLSADPLSQELFMCCVSVF